jgi:hypothetical protein
MNIYRQDWEAVSNGQIIRRVSPSTIEYIAKVYPAINGRLSAEGWQLTKLIAATPNLLEALRLIANWPLDPYAHIPELQALGEPQWPGKKSPALALAAARRLARATIAKLQEAQP